MGGGSGWVKGLSHSAINGLGKTDQNQIGFKKKKEEKLSKIRFFLFYLQKYGLFCKIWIFMFLFGKIRFLYNNNLCYFNNNFCYYTKNRIFKNKNVKVYIFPNKLYFYK